jgi:hypothetical protein
MGKAEIFYSRKEACGKTKKKWSSRAAGNAEDLGTPIAQICVVSINSLRQSVQEVCSISLGNAFFYLLAFH